MAKPRKAIKSVEKTVSIDEDLVARVDLELFSELEGKVPFGAWKKYLQSLILEDLRKRGQGGDNGGR